MMKTVKSFIWSTERKEDSELFAALGAEALAKFDRILMNNTIELLLEANAEHICLFVDEMMLDEMFHAETYKDIFTFLHSPETPDGLPRLIEKQLKTEEKFFITKSNSFGFFPALFAGLKNYLEIEEDVCVLYASKSERLCALGATRFEDSLLQFLDDRHTKQDFVYSMDSPDRYYIFQNNLFVVDTVADFRELYRRLSHRENIHLCSKYFYDQFTEIFIEFKELLK